MRFETLDSTNDEARRLIRAGEGHGLVVSAAEQTAGRGRRGRAWTSLRGNLHASMALEPGKPPAEMAQISFVAGLALAEALGILAPHVEIRCKWPNDLLANDRKLAGMLLEAEGNFLILGLGVDVVAAPDPALYPAISLAELGLELSAEQVLAAFLASFAPWFETWRSQGFGPVRQAWLGHAKNLGGEIKARLPNETLQGRFAGLDQNGALLLEMPNGAIRTILAGDVFFAR